MERLNELDAVEKNILSCLQSAGKEKKICLVLTNSFNC